MRVIVVSDIFGRTTALDEFCNDLTTSTVEIVDPYEGRDMDFKDESSAYAYFKEHVGIEKYSEVLIQKIINKSVDDKTELNNYRFKKDGVEVDEKNIIIGFSFGASAIWKLSNQLTADSVSKAYCFYGSQIRNLTHINPLFDIDLFLPHEELTFSVDELSQAISNKPKVSVYKTQHLHGFMNAYSNNYNEVAYKQYLLHLTESIC